MPFKNMIDSVLYRGNRYVQLREPPARQTDLVPDEQYFFISARTGRRLFCANFKPKDDMQQMGMVHFVHGYSEHGECYYEIAKMLAEKGYISSILDHYGHGRSDGPRSFVNTIDVYKDDLLQNVDFLKSKYSVMPSFIVGHSMGGTIALKAGLERPREFDGMTLCSPAVIIDPKLATVWKLLFARLIGKFFPKCPISYLSSDLVYRDEEQIKISKHDKLRFNGFSKAGWALAMLNAFDEIQAKIGTIDWPLLILHGEDDRVVKVEGSRMIYKNCSSMDKEIIIYPQAYHHLLLEKKDVRDRVKADIIDWIVNRSPEA